jgi:hypothetical protein
MKPNTELVVATRFLAQYNHLNSTYYKVSDTQLNQNNIADIIAIDGITKKELKLQVTVSDSGPWSLLSRGLFCRRGNANKMHGRAIREAINKKLHKYQGSSRGVILLLDGWFSVTRETLDNVRQNDQVFLQKAGFEEIWFVGNRDDTIFKLI